MTEVDKPLYVSPLLTLSHPPMLHLCRMNFAFFIAFATWFFICQLTFVCGLPHSSYGLEANEIQIALLLLKADFHTLLPSSKSDGAYHDVFSALRTRLSICADAGKASLSVGKGLNGSHRSDLVFHPSHIVWVL